MRTSRSITRSLLVMFMLSVLAFAGCAPKPVVEYGSQELQHIEQGQPAPYTGWLMSDQELELLLKAARPGELQV